MVHYLLTTIYRHTKIYVSITQSIKLGQKLLKPGLGTQFFIMLFFLLQCMLKIFRHKRTFKILHEIRKTVSEKETHDLNDIL